jgi:hypothetical protein
MHEARFRKGWGVGGGLIQCGAHGTERGLPDQ